MLSPTKIAVATSALVAVLVLLVAPGTWAAVVLPLAALTVGCYAVHVGVLLHRPSRSWRSRLAHPETWGYLGAGLTLHALSTAVAPALVTAPTLVKALLWAAGLLAFPVTALGLVEMMRSRLGDRSKDHAFESVIAAGTVSLLAWVTLIEPSLDTQRLALMTGVNDAVRITALLVLSSLSLHLLLSFGRQRPAFTALAVAQTLPVVGALISLTNNGLVLATPSPVSGAFAIIAMAFLAIGALEPSMSLYEEPCGPSGAKLGKERLLGLITPVILGPTLLTLCLTGQMSLSPGAVATYTIILSMLVVVHLIAMVQARASSTHWASHDKLTGLPNRALFRERTAQALERARKLDNDVAIIYLDLDRFKHINDSMGHEAGDQLLEQVARRILSCIDASDTVARLGGDEFAILLTSVDGDRIPRQLARRLLKSFSGPFQLKPRPVFVTPSLGIAVSNGDASLETLLTQADTAMYRAKECGRNNFAVWSQDMNEAAKQRLVLETHLHSAITNKELRLVYQPKVNMATGTVVGVEALVRWHHPKLGAISPATFIHLAEETGLINQIGEWVLETACTQARAWYDNGHEITMAVNLSSRQFQQGKIADLISRVLRSTRLDPQLLELELTESVAMSGEDATIATLNELRDMGVKCSIDDFGTGYSNLSYLSRFPIDSLKIDKSFIEQIDESGGDAAIVVAIIAMAHGLGLKVVAEGVETPKQAAFLARHKCDELQGYLFSRPLPADELESLLTLERVANAQATAAPRPPANARPARTQPFAKSGSGQRRVLGPAPVPERQDQNGAAAADNRPAGAPRTDAQPRRLEREIPVHDRTVANGDALPGTAGRPAS